MNHVTPPATGPFSADGPSAASRMSRAVAPLLAVVAVILLSALSLAGLTMAPGQAEWPVWLNR
jgi:hypothetical protein